MLEPITNQRTTKNFSIPHWFQINTIKYRKIFQNKTLKVAARAATFTVLTPYSNLHSAHTLQQPSQCSHPTATFTVLTPYNLHSAHTLQRSTTELQSATTNTTNKYTPYAVTRGLFLLMMSIKMPETCRDGSQY